MRKPTEHELTDLLVRLHDGNWAYVNAAGLPRAAEAAAAKLWKERTPESEDTQILRQQLQALDTKGRFDLRPDSDYPLGTHPDVVAAMERIAKQAHDEEPYTGVEGYVPDLGATVRECCSCGCLVPGGPTRCKRCAREAKLTELFEPVGVVWAEDCLQESELTTSLERLGFEVLGSYSGTGFKRAVAFVQL